MITIANDVIQNDIQVKAFGMAFDGKVKNLLSVNKDAKTSKGVKYGILTGVLYMASADSSGYNVCPSMTKGCKAGCLVTSGCGRYFNNKAGKMRKVYQFTLRQNEFMHRLAMEIDMLVVKAKYQDLIPAVRLNGTSDIDYENIPVMGHNNIFEMFPNVQFYDYTKGYNRLAVCDKINNYHLVFSRAETTLSHTQTMAALDNGYSVAVVFGGEFPDTWEGYPVVNGDNHDYRPLEHNVVFALSPKGDAIKDDTGFVVR